MLKTYYRQKFRVRNLKSNSIVNLNQKVDKNGRDIMTSSFDTYEEAQTELDRFLKFVPHYRPYYTIEGYSDSVPHDLDIKDPEMHRELERQRVFSGKGLAENTSIRKSDENRYSPDKWYGKDVAFAQSAERNKGLSLVAKLKDKKSFEEGNDLPLFFKLAKRPDHGHMLLKRDIVDVMIAKYKNGEFANRKEMKEYLRERGYSSRVSYKICNQMFLKP